MTSWARAVVGALALAGATVPDRVEAHGAAPAALGVIGDDLADPVIRLGFGLATPWSGEGPDRYRYLCPTVFGAEDHVPAAARLPDGRIVIASADALWVGDASGCRFEAVGAPEFADETPVAVVVVPGPPISIVVAKRSNAGSTLWLYGLEDDATDGSVVFGERELLPEVRVDDLAVPRGGGFLALAARPRPMVVRRGRRGNDSWAIGGIDEGFHALTFRFVDERDARHLVIGGPTDDGQAAAESFDGGLTAEVVLRGRERLHGPVPFGRGLLAVLDGVLVHRTAGVVGFRPAPGVAPTCLSARGDAPLACLDRDLVRLRWVADDAEPAVEPFFALDALRGVDLECPVDGELSAACTSAWIHFGGEAGLVTFDAGASDPVAEGETRGDASVGAVLAAPGPGSGDAAGCGAVRPSSASIGMLPITFTALTLGYHLAAGRRRPRRRRSPHAHFVHAPRSDLARRARV